jgi:hypothetical protein
LTRRPSVRPNTRRIDHSVVDAGRPERAVQPEPVMSGLVDQHPNWLGQLREPAPHGRDQLQNLAAIAAVDLVAATV